MKTDVVLFVANFLFVLANGYLVVKRKGQWGFNLFCGSINLIACVVLVAK